MIINNVFVARVVQFAPVEFIGDEVFLEFLKDDLRIVILIDDVIIDVFNKQIYNRVPVIDGEIPNEYLYDLGNDLYIYQLFIPNFNIIEEELLNLQVNIKNTCQWYQSLINNDKVTILGIERHIRYKDYDRKSSSSKAKIIKFPKSNK